MAEVGKETAAAAEQATPTTAPQLPITVEFS